MSIGFPQNAPPWTLPYDNGASADWSDNPAAWVQVVGAGTIVVTLNDGADTSASFPCTGGEVIPGCFSGLTSNSATRIRAGNGALEAVDLPTAARLREEVLAMTGVLGVNPHDPFWATAGGGVRWCLAVSSSRWVLPTLFQSASCCSRACCWAKPCWKASSLAFRA